MIFGAVGLTGLTIFRTGFHPERFEDEWADLWKESSESGADWIFTGIEDLLFNNLG
jgi:hypothetical protein